MDQIRDTIKSEKAIVMSNGSFQYQMGACAWIIESEMVADHIEGSMEMPGSPCDHSSFQSKAVGQYGLLITLHYILHKHQEGGTIKVACDGQLVLDWLHSTKSIDPFYSSCRSIMCMSKYHGPTPM